MDVNSELITAAAYGDLAGVQRAIDDGADVNYNLDLSHDSELDHVGGTALMFASRGYFWNKPCNGIEIVKLLLEHGADVNIKSLVYGDTALMYASIYNKSEIVKLLLEHGADVNAQNKEGSTALMWPEAVLQTPESVGFLLHYDAVNAQNKRGEIVKILLDHGVNVNTQNKRGETALMFSNYAKISKIFLDHGAHVNTQDKNGKTALMYASDPALMYLQDRHGEHADEYALADLPDLQYTYPGKFFQPNYTKNVKLLLDHGADPNLQDNDGDTALMLAKNSDIQTLLLSYGADPFIKNNQGKFAEVQKAYAKSLLKYPINAPNKAFENIQEASVNEDYMEMLRLIRQNAGLESQLSTALRHGDHAKANRLRRQVAGASQIYLPPGVQKKITSYLFQDLKSLTVSQLRRVYQKVYGKKCPAKTKREILKLLHRK